MAEINTTLLIVGIWGAMALSSPPGQAFLKSLVSASHAVIEATRTDVKGVAQYVVDLGLAAIAISQSRIWEGKKITKWVADQLKIPKGELGDIIEKLKDAAGSRGNENVKIDVDTGDVTDSETGEPIGNVNDER